MEYLENKGHDRRAWLLAMSALFIFGAFLGCAIYRLLGLSESELYDNLIERYFLALFKSCNSSADILRVVADLCLHELWTFVLVFAASFTLYTGMASGLVLLWRGLLFGFALTMLQFCTRTGLLLDSLVYLSVSAAITFLLILLTLYASEHFYARRLSPKAMTLIFLRISVLVCVNIIFMLFLIYVYI